MIPWLKADEIQPLEGQIYLVTDGEALDFGCFRGGVRKQWVTESDIDGFGPVTHYAEVNLPGEETK